MQMNAFLSAVSQGLLWSVLAMGVYITYRILDFADLTTEGSYPLGAAVATSLIVAGANPFAASAAAFGAGILAGLVTGALNTKLKIPGLLSGILVMSGLYSINLRIMGKANLPLLKRPTIISAVSDNFGLTSSQSSMLVGAVLAISVIIILYLMFSTELGFAIRATGNNRKMIRALGVNTDNMTMLGLMLSNALISLAGAVIAQDNGFSDVGMGTGTIVIGLASVIIGEVIFGRKSVLRSLISVVLGSVLYRIIIAYVLDRGLMPTDLKLVSSVLLAVCLSLPMFKAKYNSLIKRRSGDAKG